MNGKTSTLFEEIKTYLDPSLKCETLFDWFKDNVIIKDPLLFFDFRPDTNIVYIRNKKSGIIESKFKIQCLDKIDDDLSFEENEEELNNNQIDINNIDQLTNAVNNKDKLQQAGLGQISDNANKALGMYGKAMDQIISNTTEIAQKMLNSK